MTPFLLFYIPVILEVIFDYRRIVLKKKEDNHAADIPIRFAFILVASVVNHYLTGATVWQGMLLGVSFFWLKFDYALNVACGRNFFYMGNSSWMDRKIGWIPWPWLLLIKLWVFGVGVGFYYHLDKITGNWIW
jgi:hypothetical protein